MRVRASDQVQMASDHQGALVSQFNRLNFGKYPHYPINMGQEQAADLGYSQRVRHRILGKKPGNAARGERSTS